MLRLSMSYVVVFLLFTSSSFAQWVTVEEYSGYSCVGTPSYAKAYLMNTCINIDSYSSVFYTASSYRSYSRQDCAGSYYSYSVESGCSYGTKTTVNTSNAMQWSGYGSVQSLEGCGGSTPIYIYINSYMDVCDSGTLYAYSGGGKCMRQSYTSSTCSGTPYSSSIFRPSCSSNNVTTGCFVNGVFEPDVPAGFVPAKTAIVTRNYRRSGCNTTPYRIDYTPIFPCNGYGTMANAYASNVTYTNYVNNNCTGESYQQQGNYVYISGSCSGSYSSSTTRSSTTTYGPLPSAVSGYTRVTQDKCDAPTAVYSATTYSPTCSLDYDNITSWRYDCTTSGSNVTVTLSHFANKGCSGISISTDVNVYPICEESTNGGTVVKRGCYASFQSTSSAVSSHMLASSFIYVVMMVVMVVVIGA
eukprot:TRINITY_DN444_c0_g1_i1.p1 TRINITY_DN444_c0_g1~~TRINITY_DN444_c0_g1_i1.p1  ORF type:complete len:414 (-),score=55.05 TRINITY_DN444_c0_g1_i1:16-1257(-)